MKKFNDPIEDLTGAFVPRVKDKFRQDWPAFKRDIVRVPLALALILLSVILYGEVARWLK